MAAESRLALRPLLTGLAGLGLLSAGVAIGATLWPRMEMVEQQVISPAIRAAAPDREASAWPDLVAATCPAIVAVEPASMPRRSPGTVEGKASSRARRDPRPRRLPGFLVSGNGELLTSAASLPPVGDLFVLLNDGRRLAATRFGSDPASGLALLKVRGTGFPFLRLAAGNFPRIGEQTLTVNSPNGTGCVAQLGLVSADFLAEQGIDRSYARVAPQLDGALVAAPVLSADGRVAGIAGLGRPSGASPPASKDASMILPAATASGVLSELRRSGNLLPNPLGLYVEDLTPDLGARLGATRQRGAVVTMVALGSPAERAGVHAGDIVFSVDGGPIASVFEFGRALDAGGDQIGMELLRRANRMAVSLTRPPRGVRG